MTRKIPDLNGIVIEHRGYHDNKRYPENSLKAFARSKKDGMPIELDVQLTADGELMVFHDENLERMTGMNAKIQEVKYAEIRDLRLAGTNERIPKFAEVLDLISGEVMIDIEIKPAERIEATCRKVLEVLEGYPRNYLLKSFDPRIVLWLRRHAPELPCGMLITESVGKGWLIDYLVKSRLMVRLCRPDFVAIHKTLFARRRWQEMTAKRPVLLWTIERASEIKKRRNVGYICNEPFRGD